MLHLRTKKLRLVTLALISGAIAGCGGQQTSSGDQGSSGKVDGRWLNAGNVELVYESRIRMDAINAGESQFEADRSCKAMLPMAQKALNESSGGSDVQFMYKTCNDAGLKFQNKVRCQEDQLQVLCR